MAIIPVPSALKIRSWNWTLSRPTQLNRSGWTGRRQVFGVPGHAMWRAEVELAALAESDALQMKAFLFSLKGQVNTFRLPAVETAQNANSGVTLQGSVTAGTTSIVLAGATTAMIPGQMMTVNDQLLGITGVSSSTISFEPALRASASAGAAVETSLPTALVAMPDPTITWSVDLGPIYSFAFSVEEAF